MAKKKPLISILKTQQQNQHNKGVYINQDNFICSMNQTQSKTGRKFPRQTPSTSFNPESTVKQSNLTFYNSTLQQKRKTQSKRYTFNLNNQTETISNHNKTIDFSQFRTHRKTFSQGKPNDFHPLPQIRIPKNKRHAKKGTFLEIWLNQALDQGNNQPTQSQATSQNDQTLGALKSYGLDKKMLKSKHISQQTIEKIYKKLYIYTKGLGMTFNQISKLASSKLSQDDHSPGVEVNAITQIFWKAFTKLLQNESPYETAFQTIEKGYVRTINELRDKMKAIGQEVQKMCREHEEQKRKQQRQVEQLMIKYKHLQSDFNVTKATLQLTDKTLEQQILLRLKFQQKINSVYCSYDQIKTKYNSLVEQIKMKKQHSIQMEQQEKSLRQQLNNVTVTCKQLEHLLQIERAKNRDFQSEIVIKNEERSQLERELLQREQLKEQETDQIAEQLQRNKLLHSLLNQTNIEKDRLKQLYQQQKNISAKLQGRINELTEINNTLYQEKYHIHSQSERIKEKNYQLSHQLSNKTQQLNSLLKQTTILKQQIASLSHQLSHQKNLKSQFSQQLQINSSLLLQSNQTLQKLKQIKDRHQRLHQIAQHDKKLAIEQKLAAMFKMQQQQHQIQTLQNQLQQCRNEGDIMVNRLNKGNELNKKKIVELEEQLNRKDKIILTHMNSIQVEKIAVMKREKQIEQLKQQLQTKNSLIYQLQTQHLHLSTSQPLIQQQLHLKQLQLQTQTQNLTSTLAHQSTLVNQVHSIQELLKIKNNQTHIQIGACKKLVEYYRLLFMEKRNFIHPMIYEDLLAHLLRNRQKMQKMADQLLAMRQIKHQYQQRQDTLIKEKLNLQQTINKLTQNLNQITLTNSTLSTQNHQLISSLQQSLNKLQTSLHQQTQLQQQIYTLKQSNQQSSKQLIENNQLLGQLQKELQAKTQLFQAQQQLFQAKYQTLQKELQNLNQKLKQKNLQSFTEHSPIGYTNSLSKQVQTQPKQLKQLDSTASHFPSQLSFQTPAKKRQLTPSLNQGFTPQSKQIVQDLLNQTQRQDYSQRYVPIEEKIEFQTQKQIKQIAKDATKIISGEKKKVQKKDFQKALKLTFMRR